MSDTCPKCAQLSKKIEQLEERIRLDDIRLKAILKRADKYAIERHEVKKKLLCTQLSNCGIHHLRSPDIKLGELCQYCVDDNKRLSELEEKEREKKTESDESSANLPESEPCFYTHTHLGEPDMYCPKCLSTEPRTEKDEMEMLVTWSRERMK